MTAYEIQSQNVTSSAETNGRQVNEYGYEAGNGGQQEASQARNAGRAPNRARSGVRAVYSTDHPERAEGRRNPRDYGWLGCGKNVWQATVVLHRKATVLILFTEFVSKVCSC
jgi:hypothetical protein